MDVSVSQYLLLSAPFVFMLKDNIVYKSQYSFREFEESDLLFHSVSAVLSRRTSHSELRI